MKQLIRIFALAGVLAYFSAPVLAQEPPGYMGKRMVIGYGFHTVPAWENPNALGESNPYSFNYRHRVHFEWVNARNKTMSLNIGRMRTFNELTRFGFTGEPRWEDPTKNAQVKAWHIGPEWRWYGRSTSVAPLGTYYSMGFDMIFYKSVPFPGTFAYRDPLTEGTIDGTADFLTNNSWTTLMPTIGLGVQRVIRNHVALDLGLQFGWVTTNARTSIQQFNHRELLKQASGHRLWQANLVNFRVAAGWLQ